MGFEVQAKDQFTVKKDKSEMLEQQDLKLITTLKKNMKKIPRTRFEKAMLAKRSIIEDLKLMIVL